MINSLQFTENCDMLTKEQPTLQQLIKFMRRVQSLPDGRHEIIITVEKGVQDWTVRPIGKVEK